LHQMMEELAAELSTPENRIALPPFPEKRLKLFTDHFNEHFIENRRMLLDNYLKRLLVNQYLRHSEIFISFLTPPENEELDTQTIEQHQLQNKKQQKQQNKNEEQKEISCTDSNKANDDDIDSKMAETDTPNGNQNKNKQDEQALIDKFMTTQSVEFVGLDENDEITAIAIPQAQVLKHDHTIYQIHVENANICDEDYGKWTVMKRFQDFTVFDKEMRDVITNDYPNDMGKLPPLPPKYLKILVDHLDQTFIEKRRLLLQCYTQRLLKYPLLRRHQFTLKFFQVSGYT